MNDQDKKDFIAHFGYHETYGGYVIHDDYKHNYMNAITLDEAYEHCLILNIHRGPVV